MVLPKPKLLERAKKDANQIAMFEEPEKLSGFNTKPTKALNFDPKNKE